VIPSFDQRGNLPPGIHQATWDEIVERYAINERRGQLLDGLRTAIDSLRIAGCSRVYLDGSFITDKELPGDFDACWEASGVDPDLLDPVLLNFSHRRAAQKARYGGELFPAEVAAEPGGTRFLDYFQRDRLTGEPKGIVAIDLGVPK
jgi:Family of unknown function (DUF6932)